MHSYYVYMMSNLHKNVLYVGVTNNLIRRAGEHKSNLISGFTKRYNINRLVYFEIFDDITAAINREKQIKSWSRKRKEDLIDASNKNWIDL